MREERAAAMGNPMARAKARLWEDMVMRIVDEVIRGGDERAMLSMLAVSNSIAF